MEPSHSDFTKKISSAPPWVLPFPLHLQAQRVFAEQLGKPLTKCLLLLSACPSLLYFPGDSTSQAQHRNPSSASAPASQLQALCTPPPWLPRPCHALCLVFLLTFQTDLSLSSLKPSKGFLSSPGPPCLQPQSLVRASYLVVSAPCWMPVACMPDFPSLAHSGCLGHPLPVSPPC